MSKIITGDVEITERADLVQVRDGLALPQAFTARIAGDPEVTLDVEVQGDTPVLRGYSVRSADGDLMSQNLARSPVTVKLFTRVVRAAMTRVLVGKIEYSSEPVMTSDELTPGTGRGQIGTILVVSRLPGHVPDEKKVAQQLRPRGRPRNAVNIDELQFFLDSRKTGVTLAAAQKFVSVATANRRIKAAEELGLQPREPKMAESE